jgi:hypothetical protein
MAIIKASYTRECGGAKATVRYNENRPGKDGMKTQRTLFSAEGKVEREDVYAMIDQATQNSYFFRLIISPDPEREDSDKQLSLRELTEKTIRSLEARLQLPVQWVAVIHADHTENRHVHALAIVPKRLQVRDFTLMRSAATEAALEQRRQLDLARKQRELSQQPSEDLGLEVL